MKNNILENDMIKAVEIQAKLVEEPERIVHTNNKIMLVIDGEANIKINEKKYELNKNTVINITPWTVIEINKIIRPINYILLSYNRMYISRVVTNINNDNVRLFYHLDNYELIKINSKISNELKKLLLDIREEVGEDNIDEKEEDMFTIISVIAKLINIIVLISRHIIGSKSPKPEYSIGQALIKYIYAHSSEKLTLIKLATIFFISEASVRRYIEQFSNLQFNELLYKIRLQKTEELLLYTNMSLDEIAKVAGFVDGSHINKIWNMKKEGTPLLYKQMYRSAFLSFSEEDKKLAYEIINYIRDNYNQELDIEKISKKFGLNEVKINKLLLLHVDRNFSSFLNYTRINKACELLQETEKSIIDISFEVGYNNVKTFNNNFNKYKHMKPSEFRKKEK